MNATTLGIPCFYYGSEQHLDGAGGDPNRDRYIREAMFGGAFGPFRSRDRHVFDETGDGYRALADLLTLRRGEPALRRGRQYLRPVSGDGVHFGLPTGFGGAVRGIVAWSRILADREVICVINTDIEHPHETWVTIDAGLHATGDRLRLLAAAAPAPGAPPPPTAPVEARNGMAARIEVPPGGFAAYA
jgi:glycosidase